MVMDVRTPNGQSPRERGRRVTADFSKDRVNISVRDSSGERDTSFVTGGEITVPHVSMMYSVIEWRPFRRSGLTASCSGSSIDQDVGPSFTIHRGFVVAASRWSCGTAAGRDRRRHDGAPADAGLGPEHGWSPSRTTAPPDVDSIAARLAARAVTSQRTTCAIP
jgi:hypothetical protein